MLFNNFHMLCSLLSLNLISFMFSTLQGIFSYALIPYDLPTCLLVMHEPCAVSFFSLFPPCLCCCFNKLPLCASFIESAAARCCRCCCRCLRLRRCCQLQLSLTCIQCGLKASKRGWGGGAGHAKLGCCSICVNVNIARTCEFVTLRAALRCKLQVAFFAFKCHRYL